METTEAKQRSLYAKLAEVMAAVDRVPKDGLNAHFKYRYSTESAIAEAVRKEMAERHLILIVSCVESRWTDKMFIGTYEARVVDGDSGEVATWTVIGTGQDTGDKGPYKAYTGAVKYALMKLFLIPTGDEPEDEEEPKPAKREPSGVTKLPPPRERIPAGQRLHSIEGFKYGPAPGVGLDFMTSAQLEEYTSLLEGYVGSEDPTRSKYRDEAKRKLDAVRAEVNFRTRMQK